MHAQVIHIHVANSESLYRAFMFCQITLASAWKVSKFRKSASV